MKLFIGCASSDEIPDVYFKESKKVISKLLKNNDLLFGAYDKGIMNMCYREAKLNLNKVIGVAPKVYESDLNKSNYDEKVLVNDILDRTKYLIKKSDAIIFLPGGIGTINELFASIDMKRSGEIDKPIIIYNINHYYDKLLDFLEVLYNEKFTTSEVKKLYQVSYDLEDINL